MKIDENNNDKAILIFRFSEKKWIDCFLEGRLSFSCAGAYISQGLTTSNNEQGDPYEAVFARLMRDDSRIFQAKQQLGDDLEVIEDGDYVMLRRHSAKLVPIFCFFCYLQKDLFNEGKLEYVVNNQGKIKLEFDENMYKGFVDGNKKTNCEPTVATIHSNAFVKRIKRIRDSEVGIESALKMKSITYRERNEETFYIDPTSDYDELFHKDARYKCQHEGRIILSNYRLTDIYSRYELLIDKFENNEYKITDKLPFTLEFFVKLRNGD